MKPWDIYSIYSWDFPGAGTHPAVVLGTKERAEQKPMNVLLCSSQRTTRPAKASEVILDIADGLDWATLCKCDFVIRFPRLSFHRKEER